MSGGVETRKLAVLNWAGHGNFGDELILEGLRTLFKDWQVRVYSSDDAGAYPMIDFDEVNECDLFVLGGGELINTKFLWMPSPCRFEPGTKVYRLYARTPFARKSWISQIKIPKAILGCGVEAQSAEEMGSNVIGDLEQFDYIGLRDNTAIKILSAFPQLKEKVHLFHDLAFAIDADPSIIAYLARIFPFKLHGFILAHMIGASYPCYSYHRKVRRVRDTVQGLTLEEIRRSQRVSFEKMLEAIA